MDKENDFQVFERKINIWEKNHLDDCQKKNLNIFDNKHILEIGGVTPYSEVKKYKVKTWTCFALNAIQEVRSDKYSVIKANIEEYNFKNQFYDTCVTTNCLEHINNLEKALLNVYKAMKPGGYVSILYGPVWSSHIGHHLYLVDSETMRSYTFNDDIIPPWGHLLYEVNDLKEYILDKGYEERVATLIVNQIYHSSIINRLFYDDYIDIFNRVFKYTDLEVKEFRNWHNPVYPDREMNKKLLHKHNKNDFGVISSKWLLKKG